MVVENVDHYHGFEQGPIRPPSEAGSLLIRVTRNCPWNRCTFCGLYKGQDFSLRPLAHVLRDIDTVYGHVVQLRQLQASSGIIQYSAVAAMLRSLSADEQVAFHAALHWVRKGNGSVFLQDSNSLIIKPDHLVAILVHLKQRFPEINRITSYARSKTIARISDENLTRIAEAGLNRVHIGLESGSGAILKKINKGADKTIHIRAGQKVRQAGMELSEYFMPGIGGKSLTRENALETADALNQINPDFIRLRTLALPDCIDLAAEYRDGSFEKLGDRETAGEILLFLDSLEGITSVVKSDHILNLFEEVEGVLPGDKEKMTGVIKQFLAMPEPEQLLYQVGRRSGIFRRLADLNDPELRSIAEKSCRQLKVTPENLDSILDELIKRFI